MKKNNIEISENNLDVNNNNFWDFGNIIQEDRTEIPSSSKQRKDRMMELIESRTNVASNSFEKFFLDFLSLEDNLSILDIIKVYKDDYCFLAIKNNKKIALYGIDSITRFDRKKEEDRLINLKNKIEDECDINIDTITYLNVSRSKNVDIKTFL
jgi:hypothetical protein